MSTLDQLHQKLKDAEEATKVIEEQILNEKKVGKKAFIDSIKDSLRQYGVTQTDLKAFLKTKSSKKTTAAKTKKPNQKVAATKSASTETK